MHFTLKALQLCQYDLPQKLSLIYSEPLDFIELTGKVLKATFIQQWLDILDAGLLLGRTLGGHNPVLDINK